MKTAIDPATAADIAAIPFETKLLIIGGALTVIGVLVRMFKFKAAVPFALAFGGIAYVDYTSSGVTLVGAFFVALIVVALWLASHTKKAAKAAAEPVAPGMDRKSRKAKANA